MKTLLLDNHDSFTYNLFQYVAELGGNPAVFRNDEITLREIDELSPTRIIISPGPGTPEHKEDVGICEEMITTYAGRIPLLGVCLGHQMIGHVFGGTIRRAPRVMHGKTSRARLDRNDRAHRSIFASLPEEIEVMRYHSLMVDETTLPSELAVTARTLDDNVIMALQHKQLPLYGIQFHPESIGTPLGMRIIKNFLEI